MFASSWPSITVFALVTFTPMSGWLKVPRARGCGSENTLLSWFVTVGFGVCCSVGSSSLAKVSGTSLSAGSSCNAAGVGRPQEISKTLAAASNAAALRRPNIFSTLAAGVRGGRDNFLCR